MKSQFLKKSASTVLAVVFSMCLLFSMCVVSFATELETPEQQIEVQNTTYYPTSGMSSGVFSGIQSSAATFSLPSGRIYIAYSYESPNSGDYIKFTKDGNFVKAQLPIHDGSLGYTYVDLPSNGSWTVTINSISNGDRKIYGYDLYR